MRLSSPFWTADRHAARRPKLLARAAIIAATRRLFDAEGFVEVDPSALQASPSGEAHLHAFQTILKTIDGAQNRAYLHTSPEFAMKKLLAAGETKIFSLAHVYRNRERGPLHAPEFSMLEWYRVGEPLEALMADCAALVKLAAEAAGASRLSFRGREADPFAEPERLSVRDAFLKHARVDLFESLSAPERTPDRDRLASQARALGLRVAEDDSWSDVFSRMLTDRIEPNLGLGRATLLFDYPASEAALAKLSPDDPRFARRFELYACGVELANAFDELTDSLEQQRRFAVEAVKKRKAYGEAFPVDLDFLSALEHMPAASGAALGFDRLAMLATGAERIDDVQWAPVFEAGDAP